MKTLEFKPQICNNLIVLRRRWSFLMPPLGQDFTVLSTPGGGI
jgi:hypothetical protein